MIVVILIFLNQNPLTVDGFSEYDGKRKLDISLINAGNHDIVISEVTVNGRAPEKAQLVISYSGHLVGSGIDFENSVKFLEVNEEPISPTNSPQEINQTTQTSNSPIHYGIRLLNDEDVETVKIKYRYWGGDSI